ncbi:small COPII coat GTPase SAR1-like [Dysidea avara]|uniref:small COPII coat GTPase SAR1-like n=1 Tax=Dysidea avara TaxID=196820 RepID=UPI003326C87D
MFLWDWFSGLMTYLGLWRKQGKLVFTGLDNSGKTTLLYLLSEQIEPSYYRRNNMYREAAQLTLGDVCYSIYELSSACGVKKWKDQFDTLDGIVYFIDTTDRDRFEESKQELDSLLCHEQIAKVPILVLANKIDRPCVASEEEIKQVFGLQQLTTGKGNVPLSELQTRPLEVFICSVLKRHGYAEGFKWLDQYTNAK